MKKIANVLWGIVLITIGVIIGLNALDITHINIFFSGWWTLFIIIPCFIGLFNEKDKTGNIIGLFIGIVLLLCAQNLLRFDIVWKLALPTILVIIGISIIFKNSLNSKFNNEIEKINQISNKDSEYCSTFSSQDIGFENQEFKGANLTAVFGGVKCDLRKSIINEDQVVNCSAIFGSIEIIPSEEINIKVKSNSIFGGVSNERKNKEINKELKTVYINAFCLFGGVSIK